MLATLRGYEVIVRGGLWQMLQSALYNRVIAFLSSGVPVKSARGPRN